MEVDIKMEKEVRWLQWQVTLPFSLDFSLHPVSSHPPRLLKRLKFQKTHWGLNVSDLLNLSKLNETFLVVPFNFTITTTPLMVLSLALWLLPFLAGNTFLRVWNVRVVMVRCLELVSGISINTLEFKFVLNELSNVSWFNWISFVVTLKDVVGREPAKNSMEPSKLELVFLFWSALRKTQDSFASSETRTFTVSRMFWESMRNLS